MAEKELFRDFYEYLRTLTLVLRALTLAWVKPG